MIPIPSAKKDCHKTYIRTEWLKKNKIHDDYIILEITDIEFHG